VIGKGEILVWSPRESSKQPVGLVGQVGLVGHVGRSAAGRVIFSLSFRALRGVSINQEGGFHESRKSFDPASRLVPVLGGPADRDDGDPPGARAREDEKFLTKPLVIEDQAASSSAACRR
jgi:hypothetical protein